MQPRVYGPYAHRDRWRVHVVTVDGRGTRSRVYQSFESWDAAEAFANGARDEAQGNTVGMAVEALLESMREDGLGAGTVKTAEFRLRHFFGLPANERRPIRWLVPRGSELYAKAREDRAADTHHAELGLAKQLGDLAVKRRWLRTNPFADVEPVGRKRHGSSKPRLRVDESRKLWAWCVEHGNEPRAVITLAYLLLGARASELVNRDVRDLDDDGRLIWIDRTKTAAGSRRLAVPDPLREMLLDLAKGRPSTAPLFVQDGERVTRRWAAYHVAAVCGAAGVPVLPPQALRRTWSDMATDAGEASIAVARHLGHTSSTVTDRSYRNREVREDARSERALRVISGGKR